jgi:hypothetical protein
MLTLVLVASLNASLVHEPARFSAHLIEAQAPENQPQDYSTWSREDLVKEYNRLDAERPSLALPIGLMVTGGVGAIIGLYCAFFGLVLSAAGSASSTLYIVAAVLGLAGVGLLVSGIVTLLGALHDRRSMSAEMDRIKERLDGTQQPGLPPPPPAGPVPPPPPPPTQVFAPVKATIELASF